MTGRSIPGPSGTDSHRRFAASHRDLRGRLEVQLKARDETLPVSASYAHLFRQM